MKVAFIVGPYRAATVAGIVENIHRAEAYAKKYWQLGYAVICPHMNTALFDGVCLDKVFLDGMREVLRRCDAVVLTPGWRGSSGSLDEYRDALNYGKEIIEETE